MKKLETVENRVLAVLKEHPEARNDDMKAFLKEMREEFFRHKMFNEWIDYCARENPILTDLMQLEQREEYEKRMNERLRCKM